MPKRYFDQRMQLLLCNSKEMGTDVTVVKSDAIDMFVSSDRPFASWRKEGGKLTHPSPPLHSTRFQDVIDCTKTIRFTIISYKSSFRHSSHLSKKLKHSSQTTQNATTGGLDDDYQYKTRRTSNTASLDQFVCNNKEN